MKEGEAVTPDGVKIYFLESESYDSALLPLLIVPGMMGIAEFHQAEIENLSGHRVIAFSHRGLGKSGPIKNGQASFSQRCSDIEAVVKHCGLTKYALYGFSRGVPMAIFHSLWHSTSVLGLILHDCEPIYPKPSEQWQERIVAAHLPHVPAATAVAYCKDAEAVDLTDNLSEIRCPVLILRGERKGSLLPLQTAQSLCQALSKAQIRSLPNSAHERSDQDLDLFISQLGAFLRFL